MKTAAKKERPTIHDAPHARGACSDPPCENEPIAFRLTERAWDLAANVLASEIGRAS